MNEHTLSTPRGALFVTDDGGGDRGSCVLFLHADSGCAEQWAEVRRALAPELRTVGFDFPGTGQSAPAGDEDYGFLARAAAVEHVREALELPHFVLVGHSGGAAVALEYAARHGSRVTGLLLVDPPTDPRALAEDIRAGFVRDLEGPRGLLVQQQFYQSIAGENLAVRERVLANCVRVDPRARAGFGRALAQWDPEPSLNAWRGPLLILTSTTNDTQHALYRLRPNVPHVVVPAAGHWLQLDQSALVTQAIRDFVRRVEPVPPSED